MDIDRRFRFVASLSCLHLGLILGVASGGSFPADPKLSPEIRVGIDAGDLRGSDHRMLQAAVDYVAGLGGGTVRIEPGRYQMRNALCLRSNVRVVGEPGKSILVACNGFRTRLSADGDANERQITVEDPSGLQLGDGVAIQDRRSGGGFAVTTATLTARVDANTFRLSKPLYFDYLVSNQAAAQLVFPVVGGWNIQNAALEGLTIEGNRAHSESLDGCRGGGIYLFECDSVAIRNCVVREYKGDGISFQVSHHVTIEDCLAERNGGLGLHPGSGSQYPILRRNRSIGNDQDGLFVCWRVQHGVFEQNELCGNKRNGISIGHKDTDNRFTKNIIASNGEAGILFRDESEAMGAHRNVFEDNHLLNNGKTSKGEAAFASIVIRGSHNNLIFRRNTIGHSNPVPGPGFLVSTVARDLTSEQNQFTNVSREVATAEK
ncbi:MAG TPA: right-handed parallel beta-helix repeat-containing protein [Gemmataceae bacterium]|nr:right-handed parallel beta-helix repeat-containing protein [Gemmataceae bacterium]